MADPPWNTFIEGDNLDVLPTLEAEFGKVDLVYIDPPYNTGNEFAYRDDIRGEQGGSRHDAWVAMMRPRLEAARELLDGAGRDLREHRRQRGGVPAAADGRGVRGGELPGPGRGQPQPEGPAAGEGVRDEPRVPAGLREGREADRARREQHRHRGGERLPAGRRGRAALPAPAAAQHQQEVQPGDGTDPALPGVRRPGQRPGADPAVRGRPRDRAGLRRRHAGGVAVERAR